MQPLEKAEGQRDRDKEIERLSRQNKPRRNRALNDSNNSREIYGGGEEVRWCR